MKALKNIVWAILIIGFGMVVFAKCIPEETKQESNTVEVLSDFEVYGTKY